MTLAPEDPFSGKAIREGECLIWTGRKTDEGYAVMTHKRRQTYAHRCAWELTHGPVPAGMQVDHTCHRRDCVFVGHLRLATPAQNQMNRSGPTRNRKEPLPRGVWRNYKGFSARVQKDGINYHLGTFATPEEASAVASAKRKELFGVFAGKD